MNMTLIKTFQLLLVLCMGIWAQGHFFEVISIEGTGKVQRSHKNEWEKISVGTKLYDNDLVETYFQTKMIMRFGQNNIVILGSNSKALLNILSKEDHRGTISNVNLTLFGGGIFAKAISKCHISFYSANAVGETDSGSVSMVTDARSGETGFQVLGGSVYVRNIAQQKGSALRAGHTTMILPNKEPTAPLYLTNRHAAVLRHYIGKDYIDNELEASGIEPTDEQGIGSRLSLSQNLSNQTTSNTDQGTYRSSYSPEKIYGSLLADQANFPLYTSIPKPLPALSKRSFLRFNSDFGIATDGVKTSFSLNPSLNLPRIKAALQFKIGQNMSGMSPGFTTAQGLLDKIEYLYLGKFSDSLYLFIGKLENYSLGYGLIVDHFSSSNPNYLFTSPGLSGQLRIRDNIDFKVFLGSLTQPTYGGVYASCQPSAYTFGVGYYFDQNHYKTNFDTTNARYVSIQKPDISVPDQNDYPSNSHIYEIDFAALIVASYDFRLNLLVEFAQKLQNGNDGIVARIPTLLFDIRKMQFGGGFIVETKRLVSSHFGPHYPLNRYRLKREIDVFSDDTVFTQTNYLSQKRQSTGLTLSYKANPIKGMDIDIYYKQDVISKHSHHRYISEDNSDSAVSITGDFTLRLACRINDSLVSFIKYADIYLQQYHGKLYPQDGTFFSSWGTQAGFNFLSRPLFANMSFEAGAKLLYIDGNLNNKVDSDDLIFDFFIGMRWGFL